VEVERTFRAEPTSAADARALADLIVPNVGPDVADDVRLLVSELVTNAVRHGPGEPSGPIHIRLDVEPETVRVEVEDPGAGFIPRQRDPRDDALGGWGLFLVSKLADRWGVESEPSTRVWFELDRPTSEHGPDEGELLDAIGAAVVATDRRGRITHWNRRAEALFGFARSEAVGRSVADVLLAREEPRAVRAILRRIRDGIGWEGDWHAQTKAGDPIDVTVSNTPLVDAKGLPSGTVGVFADITPRVRAERRLACQHEVARLLAGAVDLDSVAEEILSSIGRNLGWELGALYLVDPARGRLRCVAVWSGASDRAPSFLEATRSFAPVLGLGLPGRVWEEAGPVRIADVTRDANYPRRPVATLDRIRGGIGFPILLGGEVIGALEFYAPEIDPPDPDLIQIMATLGHQIGQAIERFRAREELRRSEARKSAIFNAAHDAIISIDASGAIVDLNPATEALFGFTREELLGAELASKLVPERLRGQHRRALNRFLETRHPTILDRRVEMPALRADGTEIPVELTVTLVPGPDDLLFTAYLRDISDVRSLEHQRSDVLAIERSARATAETTNDRLSFLADASVVLTSSLNYRKTLSKIAKLAVPRIADLCSVEMLEGDGSISSIDIVHANPAMADLVAAYRARFTPEEGSAIHRVISTARSELYTEIAEDLVRENVPDDEGQELIRRLQLRSAMVVPLVARGRAMGAITLVTTERSRRTYGQADLEFAEDLARRAALAVDNARLYEERSHVARTLQRSLLPPRLPTIPGIDVAALYEPAAIERNEVGGDFYDVFELSPSSWAFAIGDVCGKGVEAAAMTGFARHTIRAVALHEKSPQVVLATLSEVLRREHGERFCTVAFARLDLDATPTLTVSCGGHPLPYIVRADGSVEVVGAPGSLLGIFEIVDLEERTVELGPGDAVVFITDGLLDPRRRPALDERGISALLEEEVGRDARSMADALAKAVTDPEDPAPDDVAILVARIKP
jgi:PAS domain S-box-containing protein